MLITLSSSKLMFSKVTTPGPPFLLCKPERMAKNELLILLLSVPQWLVENTMDLRLFSASFSPKFPLEKLPAGVAARSAEPSLTQGH